MPLTINVGLSRKAAKNFQSTGVSINVTAELDQTLLARPRELQQEIDRLYTQAEHALDRQVEQMARPVGDGHPDPRSNGQYRAPSNGSATGKITAGQRRALKAIGEDLGVDPAVEARRRFGMPLGAMSIQEASQLIDHLKQAMPAETAIKRR